MVYVVGEHQRYPGVADDLILFLINQTDLQSVINLLDQIFARFGQAINALKTKSMISNYPGDKYPESIVKLKNVKTFKYFGAFEVNHRIQQAVNKFAEMTNLLRNFNIS